MSSGKKNTTFLSKKNTSSSECARKAKEDEARRDDNCSSSRAVESELLKAVPQRCFPTGVLGIVLSYLPECILSDSFLLDLTKEYISKLFTERQLEIFLLDRLAISCKRPLLDWIDHLHRKYKGYVSSKVEFLGFLSLNADPDDEKKPNEYHNFLSNLYSPMFWTRYPALGHFSDYIESLTKGGINGDCFDQENVWSEQFHVRVLKQYFGIQNKSEKE